MTFERILVAVDGSQDSSRAAAMAVDLARRNNAALFVLSVVPSVVFADAPSGVAASSQQVDKGKMEAEGWVKDVVSRAEQQGLKARGDVIENVSSIVDSIVGYAGEWKVDLVVVGTRGLGGFRRLLLGSVSSALVSRAPCSVLVVR